MANCYIMRRKHTGSEPPVSIVSWQNGTDAEIKAMIDAADAGKISLTDYWSVGDSRSVKLSRIAGGGSTHVLASMISQNVNYILMDTGSNSGYKDTFNNTVNFVVAQQDCLSSTAAINKTGTNTGSWHGSLLRSDLSTIYRNALPDTFVSCLKLMRVRTIKTYNGSTNEVTNEYIALFAEKEILGSATRSNTHEADFLTQITYYKTATNRIKKQSSSNVIWWLRSPSFSYNTYFCAINTSGNATQNKATNSYGVAPFMCI